MARPKNRPHHPPRKPDWPPGKPPWTPGPPPWWEAHNPDKFLVIGYAHGWRGDLLDIKLITDTSCHLWLRLTEIEPKIHLESMDKRGSLWMEDPRFCFVEFTDIDERDPGDHYHHFWTLPSFGIGTKKWYYFRGTIAGDLCPSISCLFSVKYHEESQMITLGIFGEAQTLEGEVKLEAGDKIKLTRDDAHNSIIIEGLVKDLADLDDVSNAPADGQVLQFEAASGLWKPATVAGGAWILVGDYILAANLTDYTIPGLNGDADKFYLVYYTINNVFAGVNHFDLFCDQLVNQFFYNHWWFDGAGGSARGGGYRLLTNLSVNHHGSGYAVIHARTGLRRFAQGISNRFWPNWSDVQLHSCAWDDTINNMTSLRFHSTGLSGIGIGSRFTLFKMA